MSTLVAAIPAVHLVFAAPIGSVAFVARVSGAGRDALDTWTLAPLLRLRLRTVSPLAGAEAGSG